MLKDLLELAGLEPGRDLVDMPEVSSECNSLSGSTTQSFESSMAEEKNEVEIVSALSSGTLMGILQLFYNVRSKKAIM